MLATSHKNIDQGRTEECVSFAALHEMSYSGFANLVAVDPECLGLPLLPGDGAIVD